MFALQISRWCCPYLAILWQFQSFHNFQKIKRMSKMQHVLDKKTSMDFVNVTLEMVRMDQMHHDHGLAV
jgi:hypothetical protein